MSVKNTDSVDKILMYLDNADTTNLVLSKLFFRHYECPENCGGCCLKFSLDYVEGERWDNFKKTYPELVSNFTKRKKNGVNFYTDFQTENNTRWCKHLNTTNGRCNIHKCNPFTCDFELIKLVNHKQKDTTFLIKKLYGRGWNLKTVDGTKGAKCYMTSFNYNKLLNDIKLLKELYVLEKLFKKESQLNKIIIYLEHNKLLFKNNVIPLKNITFSKKYKQLEEY